MTWGYLGVRPDGGLWPVLVGAARALDSQLEGLVGPV